MLNNRIGLKLAEFRQNNNLSIKDFSERSGISTASVSQLERGLGNPSLSVLKKLSETLQIALPNLLSEEPENAALILRHEEQPLHTRKGEHGISYCNLTPGPVNSSVELLQLTLAPKGETNEGFSQHFEEETAYIAEGRAEMIFENETFLLFQEDTIRILPERKHKLRNPTDAPVKVLFIKSKSSY